MSFTFISFALTTGILFFLLTLIRPRIGLALLVALLPTYVFRLSLYGVPTTLFEILFLGVTAGWFTHMFYKHGRLMLPTLNAAVSHANPFAPYLMPILLFLLASAIAILVAPNLETAVGLWRAYFIEPILLFGMVVLSFRHKIEKVWLLWALGAGVIIVGLTTLAQAMGLMLVPEPFASADTVRATGLYPYPNAVGLFVAPIVAMFMAWWVQRLDSESLKSLMGKLLVIVLGLVAIILSFTKGAIVALVIALIMISVTVTGWRRNILVACSIVCLGLIMLIPALRYQAVEQVTLNSPSGLMRRAVWSETFDLLNNKPVFGTGLAGYQSAVAPYHVDWRPEITPYKIETYLYPHNVFLNFWTELGILGLVAFVWLLIAFYKLVWKQRVLPLSAMAFVAMTALLVHGFVDVPYFKNDLAILFWIIMALPLLERRRIHHMHLSDEPYQMILNGTKTVEVRINDAKRKLVSAGDIIAFYPHKNSYESIHALVDEVITRETFLDLFEHIEPNEVGYSDIETVVKKIAQYYSDDEELRHGTVAYRIKLL